MDAQCTQMYLWAQEKTRSQKMILISTNEGVENLDKVTATYSCQRKTAWWALVTFSNIVDKSAYNAYVLWTEINQQWNANKLYQCRLFLKELGNALVTPKIQRRARPVRSSAAAAVIEKVKLTSSKQSAMNPLDKGIKRQKRCHVCPSREDSKTSTSCVKCKNYICTKHAVTFWWEQMLNTENLRKWDKLNEKNKHEEGKTWTK